MPSNFKAFKRQTWYSIEGRAESGYAPLRMTRDQWNRWCDENRAAIEHLCSQGLTPSVDRIDPDGAYEISNIRVEERWANVLRSRRNPPKPVEAIRGSERIRFESVKEAATELGLRVSNISACCHGRLARTGGWVFRFPYNL